MKKYTTQAVIFDLDGVITDTAELHYLAWKNLADELGLKFDRDVNEKLKGIGRVESLDIILEGSNFNFSADEKKFYTDKKNEDYKKMLKALSPKDILIGVEKLLISLKEVNIRIGLASASKNAPEVLKFLGIENYFQFVVDPSTVPGKPKPDLFLKVAEKLNVNPKYCVGIEDAQAGIEAINSAGMKSIGVGDSVRESEADLWVTSLEGVNLDTLELLFSN